MFEIVPLGAEVHSTFIKAPFDGVVERLSHQPGSLVQSSEALTILFDDSLMWVYFNVPEARYLEYKSAHLDEHMDDQKIELMRARGEKFDQPGKLGAIGADFNSATGNVPFRADFRIPRSACCIMPARPARSVDVSQVQNDAIVIPQRATFEVHDKRYVYVVDKDDVAHQREIVIQNDLKEGFVVKTGVGVDDRIVIEGVGLVRDGAKVEYEVRPPMKGAANP